MIAFSDRLPTRTRQWVVVGRYRSANAAHVAASNLRRGKVPSVNPSGITFKVKHLGGGSTFVAMVVARREGD